MSTVMANTATVPPHTSEDVPYKFLEFYSDSKKDQRTFTGRDRDIREVVARVATERASILYGRSGLGKTSLLLAGIFPELRARGFLPIYCRVLESPLADVRRALAKALDCEVPLDPKEAITAFGALRTHPVLVLDQFEEFFVRFAKKPELKQALVDWLEPVVASSAIDFRILISLREDYLTLLDEFGEDFRKRFGAEYRLRPLSAFGARQAILRPLLESGISYEPKVVSRLVDILAAEEFDSLLLQLACTAVYQQAITRDERPVYVRESDLDSVGGLEGILGRYLDSAMLNLSPEQLLLARNVLDALISNENTKRAISLETFYKADFNATPEEIGAALEHLKKNRLVREERRKGQLWYELMHERLVAPILAWFALDKAFAEFRFARDLIMNGCRNGMFRTRLGALLSKESVEQVIYPHRERLRLDSTQAEFVFLSAVYHKAADVSYWARAVEGQRCHTLFLELMTNTDPNARAGAAAALATIPIPDNAEFVDKLFHLALNDAEPEVRRCASRSFAALSGGTGPEMLSAALKSKASRARAIETLADAYESHHWIKGVGFWAKSRAEKIAKRRIFALHRDALRGEAKTSALVGLVSSLVWSLLVGTPVLLLDGWSEGTATSDTLTVISVFLVVAAALGCFVCWRCGRLAARKTVLGRQEQWFWNVVHWRGPLIFLSIYLGLVTIFVREWVAFAGYLMVVLALFLFQLGLAAAVHLNSLVIEENARLRKVFILALLQSIGLPFLVPLLLATPYVRQLQPGDDSSTVWGVSLLIAMAWGVLSFSLTLTLARVNPLPQVHSSKLRRRILRTLVGIFVAGTILWYGLNIGFKSIPLFAGVATELSSSPGQSTTITTHLKPYWPNSYWFRVHSQAPGWYGVSNIPAKTKFSFGDMNMPDGATYVLLPPGTHMAEVSTTTVTLNSALNQPITFTPVENLSQIASLALGSVPTFRQISLQPNVNGDSWSTGDISVQLTPGDYSGKAVEITVSDTECGQNSVRGTLTFARDVSNKSAPLHWPYCFPSTATWNSFGASEAKFDVGLNDQGEAKFLLAWSPPSSTDRFQDPLTSLQMQKIHGKVLPLIVALSLVPAPAAPPTSSVDSSPNPAAGGSTTPSRNHLAEDVKHATKPRK